jgi:hypothetical protein
MRSSRIFEIRQNVVHRRTFRPRYLPDKRSDLLHPTARAICGSTCRMVQYQELASNIIGIAESGSWGVCFRWLFRDTGPEALCEISLRSTLGHPAKGESLMMPTHMPVFSQFPTICYIPEPVTMSWPGFASYECEDWKPLSVRVPNGRFAISGGIWAYHQVIFKQENQIEIKNLLIPGVHELAPTLGKFGSTWFRA